MSKKRYNLFDPSRAAGASDKPAVGRFANQRSGQNQASSADAGNQPGAIADAPVMPQMGADSENSGALSVTELISDVKNAISAGIPGKVLVSGELRNVYTTASGHIYFSLTDRY